MKVVVIAAFASALFIVVSSQLDTKCVVQNCLSEYESCLKDSGCRETVGCIVLCLAAWEVDTSDQKVMVQNCTNLCAYSSGNDVFAKTTTCIDQNKCLKLPAIPSTCNAPKMPKNITLGDLAGTKWRLRGFNGAYDCYRCQKLSLSATNFNPSFQVMVDGQSVSVDQTGTAVGTPTGFNATVVVAGMSNAMMFYPFDSIQDGGNTYFLLYYCGTANTWNYSGAYVLTEAETISSNADGMIKTSFMTNAGLDYSKFCSTTTTGC